jgi:hypothetical protein
MADLRRLGLRPPRYHAALLQRLEEGLGRLAPHVGEACPAGSANESYERALAQALQAAGLGVGDDDLRRLCAWMARGGAAGMAVAVVLATWVAEGGDEVTVAFDQLAARPMVVLQQLWTASGAPPVSNADLDSASKHPPRARAAAIMSLVRRRWP